MNRRVIEFHIAVDIVGAYMFVAWPIQVSELDVWIPFVCRLGLN